MIDLPPFIFVTCQSGVENVLKSEIAHSYSFLRPAFSRRGFVTFKFSGDIKPHEGFSLEAVFAQSWGFCFGQVSASDWGAAAQETWKKIGDTPVRWIHVWPRDSSSPGRSDPEKPWPAEIRQIYQILLDTHPAGIRLPAALDETTAAPLGIWVLDCIVVEPDEWWIGVHKTASPQSRHPGGRFPIVVPEYAVSRAYLKIEEALRWSGFAIPPGARWAELGSAPGGASQALLDRGYEVLGVDPAEMHPAVLSHPRFTHLRRRTPQAPRRAFRKVRWLTADINAAPNYTLDAVESIVTYPQVNVRGMILTLKLTEWRLAEKIPEYLERIRSWGYNDVNARHLWNNKQEICVAALMRPFRRKPGRS